jgi:hypothetical protein
MELSIFEQETQELDELLNESHVPLNIKIETQMLDLTNVDLNLPSKSINEWVIDSVRQHLDPLHEQLDPLKEQRKKRKYDLLEDAKKNKENLTQTITSLEKLKRSTNRLLISSRNQLSILQTRVNEIELELIDSRGV